MKKKAKPRSSGNGTLYSIGKMKDVIYVTEDKRMLVSSKLMHPVLMLTSGEPISIIGKRLYVSASAFVKAYPAHASAILKLESRLGICE